mgnify:CR=1 FL=1
MGKIYCMMGKSSSGKDTLYQKVLERLPQIHRVVPYTTRPIREGEQDGVEYHFVDDKQLAELETDGKIVELRAYNTVHGIWKYFTVDDGQIDLEQGDYLLIGTLETYEKIREYYGAEHLVPIYIEVEDGERLQEHWNGSADRRFQSIKRCVGDFLRMKKISARRI